MSRSLAFHALTFFALSAVRLPADDAPALFTAKEVAQGYRDHVILAKPHADRRVAVAAAETREGVRVRAKFSRIGDLRVIELDSAEEADRAINRLRATGRYEFVERDRLRRLAAVPNDPGLTAQWAISNPTGVDIKALAAWDIIRDAPNVIVAVVDSGLNLNHQDIGPNLWRNPAPLAGANDVNGANFVGGRGAIVNGSPIDEHGHGTNVAGILGAVGNNNVGIAGVAWRVQIMAVKVFQGSGTGAVSDIVAGVNYAIARGAHIINASYGETVGAEFSLAELAAITAARDAGILFVAAAGNDATNSDAVPHFPSSYPLDNVVTVGSSTRDEKLADSSNYGAAVDLIAPGAAIVSLAHSSDSGTVTVNGTSMAVPHVSGALALLKARFPADNYRQLINRLLRGTDVIPAYAGKAQTGGRLNLLAALTTTSNRPFNDDFGSRSRLSSDRCVVRSNNLGATPEAGEPSHAGATAASTLWWEWTARTSRAMRLSTAGSAYDTVLAVYTGAGVNQLALVAANDNDGGSQSSRIDFTAQAGVSYQIAVDGRNGSTGLTLLTLEPATANDAFATPTLLASTSDGVTANNNQATRETSEPRILGFPGGASLWYRWTAPRTGRFQIAVVSDDFDPILAVYTGTALNTLTLISASDNTGPGDSQPGSLCTINATSGTAYLISVDGKTPGAVGQFALTVVDSLWQAVTGSAAVPGSRLSGSPAVAADGNLYIGSTDQTLYAFSSDGTPRWSFRTGGPIDLCSPAVADDGGVCIGSNDGLLYMLNASGTQRWSRRFNIGLSTIPVSNSVALGGDGTIYVKAGDGYLYALNPADGTTRWRSNVNAPRTIASPVVGLDGTIYQGSEDRKLYAFNPDGSAKWSFTTDGEIHATPAIDAAGNAYFSVLGSGKLYSISPSGGVRWTYSGATAASSSSPALSEDAATVYFGGNDRRLHAVRTSDGSARWTFSLGGEVRESSPAVDSAGVIYVGCTDGKLYAVNGDGSLNRIWATGAAIRSNPVIFGNALYVGSDDHKLYALGLGESRAGTGPWPQYRQNARRLGRVLLEVVTQPVAQTLLVGSPLLLRVAAIGNSPLAYQWSKNGINIAGATSANLTFGSVTLADSGAYACSVSNGSGGILSRTVTVTVVNAFIAPAISMQPVSIAASPGQSVTFSVTASGTPPPTYQWQLNGVAIEGATNATLVIADASFASAGNYAVVVTNTAGSLTSAVAALNLGPAAYLSNVSVRTTVLAGQTVIVGFVVSGGTKPVLVRAAGPALLPLGITTALADPRLELYQGATRIAENNDWAPALGPTFASLGAFPFPVGSRDAAVLQNLNGAYTVQATGTGSGVVLVEGFDAGTGSNVRLVNLSARNRVGTGADLLIAGFYLSGTGTQRVLIRAIGPTLSALGVAGALADPNLEVYDGSVKLTENDNWNASLAATFASVAAFPLSLGSRDSALVATLTAGRNYTAQVSGVNGGTGDAIVEIYELP